MIALGVAEGTVLAAVIPVLIVQAVQVWQSVRASKTAKASVAELRPNGGKSMRDAIDRMERKVDRMHDRHDHLAQRIYLLEDFITKPRER